MRSEAQVTLHRLGSGGIMLSKEKHRAQSKRPVCV